MKCEIFGFMYRTATNIDIFLLFSSYPLSRVRFEHIQYMSKVVTSTKHQEVHKLKHNAPSN